MKKIKKKMMNFNLQNFLNFQLMKIIIKTQTYKIIYKKFYLNDFIIFLNIFNKVIIKIYNNK